MSHEPTTPFSRYLHSF